MGIFTLVGVFMGKVRFNKEVFQGFDFQILNLIKVARFFARGGGGGQPDNKKNKKNQNKPFSRGFRQEKRSCR